jgi:hypothetical protein
VMNEELKGMGGNSGSNWKLVQCMAVENLVVLSYVRKCVIELN